jgi:tRNA(adenine34) deaminase
MNLKSSVLFSGTNENWMDRALSLASVAASLGEVPVGCVIVNPDGLVSEAHNEKETQNNPAAHAEILAIQRAAQKLGRWRLNDCAVFVSLEPCHMCAGAMIHARVGRLVFGAADPKTGAVQSLDSLLTDPRLNHQCEVHGGFKAEQSSALLKQFFRSRRRS